MPAKLFTNRQQFLVASRGPEIAAHLIAEQDADFTATFGSPTAEALERFQKKLAKEMDITTICTAFFAKTYPVNKPTERKIDVMDWIIDRTLNDTHNGKPILCEDLYKIGEQVNYFTGLKHSGALPPDDQLTAYPSLKALGERLAPFQEKRQKKEQARLERHMPDEQRARIMAESSILYQGPSGTIVVPHTPLASQYWGNGTKWCISGKDAGLHFSKYNKKAPVILFLPRGAEKMAYADKQYWDPADESHFFSNNAVAALRAEMLERISHRHVIVHCHIKAILVQGFPINCQTKEVKTQATSGFRDSLSETERHWVESVIAKAYKRIELPPHIPKDKRVFMAAVQQNGQALRYADPALQANPAIVLAAMEQDISALDIASPQLKNSPKFARHVLEHGTPKIVLKIQEAGLNLREISDEEIFAAQVDALQQLLDEGKDDVAAAHLRFIKPLWGQAERIFGDPAVQLAYLRALPAGRPGVLPAFADLAI